MTFNEGILLMLKHPPITNRQIAAKRKQMPTQTQLIKEFNTKWKFCLEDMAAHYKLTTEQMRFEMFGSKVVAVMSGISIYESDKV